MAGDGVAGEAGWSFERVVDEGRRDRDYHCFVTNNDLRYHKVRVSGARLKICFGGFLVVLARVYIKA